MEQRDVARTYFALAFAISWAGGVLVVGPGGIPTTIGRLMTLGPAVCAPMLVGPSVAGLLMTSVVSGRAGLRELLGRLLRWRVDARWYDRTGSLLMAMLMHASLTATQLILMPPATSEIPLLISILAWAAALWLVVAVIAAVNGWRLSPQPVGTRAA